MPSQIKFIEYYLPEKTLDNWQLAKEFPEWQAEKVTEKIGINKRHISAENETALDMAHAASQKLFTNFDKSNVDFLILCTQSPDYFLPTTACILQDRLGLRTNIGALDFNLGCSGFIYGLALAKGLINSGIATCVLLITSETYSKHLHPKDKSNRSIFGDAAAAAIVTKVSEEKIFEFELGTDGKGMHNLIVPNGAFRKKANPQEPDYTDASGNIKNDNNLYMNGPEIFNFTLERIPSMIANVLVKNNTTFDEIDYIIFHQANKYMLDYLRKKLKIMPEKFYQNMENTGNTVSSTIPIALKDCMTHNIVKPGNKILLAGFGVGYSWGATIIEI
jgi:3-oxoacyl-[acyl-carrier-protein] synthase-3